MKVKYRLCRFYSDRKCVACAGRNCEGCALFNKALGDDAFLLDLGIITESDRDAMMAKGMVKFK